MRFATILLLSLLVVHLPAWSQSDWQNAEREKLLAGVETLPKNGLPGPLAIWGERAFPVVAAAAPGKPESAVCAAASFGKGRALIYGHPAYLTGEGSAGVLLLNAVRWTSQKQRPRIGLKNANLQDFFQANGLRAAVIEGPLKGKALNAFDVVIADVQDVTDEAEGQAIQSYIKRGGGFIAAMTGWAFDQTSGGKVLNLSHGLRRAFMPIGMAFTTESDAFAANEVNGFESRAELPALMNASEAINAMKRQRAGDATLSPDDIAQATSAIQLAMAAQPPEGTAFQSMVLRAFSDGEPAVPTEEFPLTQVDHADARIRLGMETRVLALAPGNEVNAHAAATAFPGLAPDDAPRVNKDIRIDPNISGWQSTGLWVNAGDSLMVTMPAENANLGYALRIGCHTDTLYHLDSWSRAPEITRSVRLTQEITSTVSAFGGLVYIDVPSSAAGAEPFTVTIDNAIEAPLFVLGETTDEEWNRRIKTRAAPWAEFACDNLILSCPTANARKVRTPTQMMTFWQKVVEAQDDLSNQTSERKRPERIVTDVQISVGYMHSGYPVMVPTSTADDMLTFTRLKFPDWGFYHELAHNHQRDTFTFEGAGEVTNNVIGMYCYQEVMGKDWLIGHTAISAEARKEFIQRIKQSDDKWQLWKSEPFLALTTYIQLVQAFGWESWRAYLYSFADESFGPVPQNDDQTRDQFLIRYSKITGKNLGPFFDFWGIPVSADAKKRVRKLEPWMPEENL